MRHWGRKILSCMVILVCLPGIWMAARRLPVRTQPMVAEKYAGWNGVLRIWMVEGWTDGGLTGWLNACAGIFENAHPGVYVEAKPVTLDALNQWRTLSPTPPDMLLFPPGTLQSPDGLALLENLPIREALGQSGRAAAVALFGYAWVVNDGAEGLAILPDDGDRAYSRAAAVMDAPGTGVDEMDIELPGVDLGLPAMSTFTQDEDAYRRFAAGELGATLASRRELLKLARLDDQGRAPEWRMDAGAAWTDQVMYLTLRDGGDERETLSRAFLDTLLSDECQENLRKWNFLPVTDAPAGVYPALDAALRREDAQIVPAF